MINFVDSELFFTNLSIRPDFNKVISNYVEYWNSITPKTEDDVFRRWLFSFTSVHTTWENNVSAYNKLKDFESWISKKDKLKDLLIESRAGLFNRRTEYIWDFSNKFWKNKSFYSKNKKLSWLNYRNKLLSEINGLGLAKISFALEMIYPAESKSVCLDTHMLELYGNKTLSYNSKSGQKTYNDIEKHWLKQCAKLDIPSCIGRAIYWDQKQDKKDSRYWTYILEN